MQWGIIAIKIGEIQAWLHTSNNISFQASFNGSSYATVFLTLLKAWPTSLWVKVCLPLALASLASPDLLLVVIYVIPAVFEPSLWVDVLHVFFFSGMFCLRWNKRMKTWRPKRHTSTANALIVTARAVAALCSSWFDCAVKYVGMSAKVNQKTSRAKVQKDTYFASLKFAGYLKLSTPRTVMQWLWQIHTGQKELERQSDPCCRLEQFLECR